MTSTTPTPIRKYLSRRNTDVRKAHARVVEAFDPKLGWHTVDLPVTLGTFATLCRRGQTSIAVRYTPPAWTVPTPQVGKPCVADFTIAECLS
jgi:hypothetical protein